MKANILKGKIVTTQVLRIAILTLSDSRDVASDKAGLAVRQMIETAGWQQVAYQLLPDDRQQIASRLAAWADDEGIDVILTVGGTGLSPRDVTPEATRDVIEREVPGIAEAIRAESWKIKHVTALSRAVCGIRGNSLILNLPGSTKGACESLSFVIDLLPHAFHTMQGGGH